MPYGNTYVVNSLELIQAVQRNQKTLSFLPLVATFLRRFCLASNTASEIVDANLLVEGRPSDFYTDSHSAVHGALAPGPGLDELINSVLPSTFDSLNALLEDRQEKEMNLYQWINDSIALTITNAVYGPQNPFQDPEVRNDFRKAENIKNRVSTDSLKLTHFYCNGCRAVEDNFFVLLLGVVARWAAPEAYRRRNHLFEAFRKYYTHRGHEKGSSLAKHRYYAAEKNGTPLEDIAKFELAGLLGC